MKKIVIVILATLFIIAGCNETTNVEKTDDYGYDLGTDHVYEKVSAKDLQEKLDNEESFFLLFGRPS